MPLPTNEEQEFLEWINRLRIDPAGEFDRLILDQAQGIAVLPTITSAIGFFGVDLALFRQQMSAFPAVAPLAWNSNLADAAQTHSALMIAQDNQSHQLPGEPSLGDRIRAAGYDFSRVGENIFAFTSSVVYGHAGFVIDWGNGVGGMQTPAGHRIALLNSAYAEIGVDVTAESNESTRVGPLVVTQNLGNRFGYAPQLVGVVFDDADGDNFYDAGEGQAGVSVSAVGTGGTFATTSWSSGGYQLELPAGEYTVTFSGGGLGGSVQRTVGLYTANEKLDVEAGAAAPVNTVPVVTVRNFAAGQAGQEISVASLFDASDAEGDTLFYNVWDSTADAASGHWVLNGVVQAANQTIGVAAADLGSLRFVTGSIGDSLQVRAADASLTSEWGAFSVSVPALPVASISADQTVNEAVVRIRFTVTLDRAPTAPVSLTWSVLPGTATVAAGDIPGGQGGQALSFVPGGPLSQDFTVMVNDEAHKAEEEEGFAVALDGASGVALARATAFVTLLDHHVPAPAVPILMRNTTTATDSTPAPADYVGPVPYLNQEFVYLGTDSIVVAAAAPNMFLRSGSGDDALSVAAGQNVLDAGTGSNFLTGGSGADTFFLDARGALAPVWSTVVGLSAGDAVTLWGVTPADFAINWFDNQGAAGFQGLTMHATAAGRPTASLTLAGFSQADQGNGRLAMVFGSDPVSGSEYLYISANG